MRRGGRGEKWRKWCSWDKGRRRQKKRRKWKRRSGGGKRFGAPSTTRWYARVVLCAPVFASMPSSSQPPRPHLLPSLHTPQASGLLPFPQQTPSQSSPLSTRLSLARGVRASVWRPGLLVGLTVLKRRPSCTWGRSRCHPGPFGRKTPFPGATPVRSPPSRPVYTTVSTSSLARPLGPLPSQGHGALASGWPSGHVSGPNQAGSGLPFLWVFPAAAMAGHGPEQSRLLRCACGSAVTWAGGSEAVGTGPPRPRSQVPRPTYP